MHRLCLTPALLLAGCHVLSPGYLETTCEDIASCGEADADTDTDTDADADADADFNFEMGLALSYQIDDRWTVATLDPPLLDPGIVITGAAQMSGPTAYDADGDAIFVATHADGILRIDADGALSRFDEPDDNVLDMAVGHNILAAVTPDALYLIDPETGASLQAFNAADAGLADLSSVFYSAGVFYGLDLGEAGGSPDIWAYDGTDTPWLEYADFDGSRSRVGGDTFLGPSTTPFVCSIAGAVYAVTELTSANAAGTTPTATAQLNASVTDVLSCGWDETEQRFIIVSASLGAWAVSQYQDDALLFGPKEDDTSAFSIGGANIW